MGGFNLGSFAGGAAQGYKQMQDIEAESQRNELAGLQIKEARRKLDAENAIRAATTSGLESATAEANQKNAQTVQADAGVRPATDVAGAGVYGAGVDTASVAADQAFIDGKPAEVTPGYTAPGVGFSKDYGTARDLATQEGAGLEVARPKVSASDIFRDKYADAVHQSYLKNGDIQGAQHFQSFMDTQDGKAYGKTWADATLALQQGDIKGSLENLETLYNKGMPDGKFVKITGNEDGKTFTVTQYDEATGKPIGSKVGTGEDVANMGIHALAPEKRLEWQLAMLKEQAKEGYDMKKQVYLQDRGMEKTAKIEEGRDRRAAANNATVLAGIEKRVAGSERNAEIRANAKTKGLTEAQQRTNEEIQGARDRLGADGGAGYIKRDDPRLKPKLESGLPNTEYDPELARDVRNAQRKLHGDDPAYDQWTKSRTQANQRTYKVGNTSFSDADIAATAAKHGLTIEATKAKLGIK